MWNYVKLRAIHIIFARAVVCWLHMQSNYRIGKNRRAENPPALLYTALEREVFAQSALLRFGKGSVGAVLSCFTCSENTTNKLCEITCKLCATHIISLCVAMRISYCSLCEIMWSYVRLRANYVRLRATHIIIRIIRAWQHVQVIACYVRLCEITCKLCEIMCNSHNYRCRAMRISYCWLCEIMCKLCEIMCNPHNHPCGAMRISYCSLCEIMWSYVKLCEIMCNSHNICTGSGLLVTYAGQLSHR